ncbi:hypothetical protein RJ639_011103 [Escallonia herrerae]|uniref:Dof zinc finger protein n=1 Tax=Escallonia herrerae TaxID=1293975 RepID=A0AA88VTQ8_9ASTE|nr:hypothetical protein RJ639_011103 [Escallonia herrerae]
MDTAQWAKEIGIVKPIATPQQERKVRPQNDQDLNCPRCHSTSTKFCYYNNYSLTQPRYFCKTCRRYWTQGGTLRNVPVGGGSRKNVKKSSTSPSSSSSHKLPDLNPQEVSHFRSDLNPKTHQGQGLNLALPPTQDYRHDAFHPPISEPLSSLELLSFTGIAPNGLNSFIPTTMSDPHTMYSSQVFPFHEFKPAVLGFSVEGIGNKYYGGVHGTQENGSGRSLVFPFGALSSKGVVSTREVDHSQDKGQGNDYSTGYHGMFR